MYLSKFRYKFLCNLSEAVNSCKGIGSLTPTGNYYFRVSVLYKS